MVQQHLGCAKTIATPIRSSRHLAIADIVRKPLRALRLLLAVLPVAAVGGALIAPCQLALAGIEIDGDYYYGPSPSDPTIFGVFPTQHLIDGYSYGYNFVTVTGGDQLFQSVPLSFVPPPDPNSTVIPTLPGVGGALVFGNGSFWDAGGIAVGGTVTVSNGGTLNAVAGISAGGNAPDAGAGTIDIKTGGTINAGNFSVGGSLLGARTTGDFHIDSGGVLNAGDGSIFTNGTVVLGDGGILNCGIITLYQDVGGTSTLQMSASSALNAIGIIMAGNTSETLTPGYGSTIGSVGLSDSAQLTLTGGTSFKLNGTGINGGVQNVPGTGASLAINNAIITADSTGVISVGATGNSGSLTITNAIVAAGSMEIGLSTDVLNGEFLYGYGTATIGFGAQVNVIGEIKVGSIFNSLTRGAGDGRLIIESGGKVKSAGAEIQGFGRQLFAHNVEVTGAGSQWTLTDTLRSDAVITINNAGQINGDAVIDSGSVDINGPGSAWTAGSITIGEGPSPYDTVFSLTSGGSVVTDDAHIGNNVSGVPTVNATVIVDGSDVNNVASSWISHSGLDVGLSSKGTLQITDGGQVTSPDSYIGINPESTGPLGGHLKGVGIVTVDGTGAINRSTWSTLGQLNVGYDGDGTLAMTNGGLVASQGSYIGANATGTGTVSVDGAGGLRSTWQSALALDVGFSGNGTLLITNGGLVTSQSGYIATNAGSIGLASVDGVNSLDNSNASTWQAGAALHVGFSGNGTLEIVDGGQVKADNAFVATDTTGVGVLTIDGAGPAGKPSALIVNADLHIGADGHGQLELTAGGHIEATESFIGTSSNGIGLASVDGTDAMGNPSTWISDNLNVGLAGGGILGITAGGQVTSNNGYIGAGATGVGAVNVDGARANGPASTWELTADVFVGVLGKGDLNITNGAQVTSVNGFLGDQSGGTGTVTVDGPKSAWQMSGYLNAGALGTGTLTVSSGGKVTTGRAFLGTNQLGNGTFTVTGSNSLLTVTNDLNVGYNLGAGTLQIMDGATVNCGRGFVGGLLANATGTVTVTDPLSVWNSDQQIDVGWLGTGELDILHGGVVNSHAATSSSGIGAVLGIQGSAVGTAKIDGAGSKWAVDGSMVVGLGFIDQALAAGGTGNLTISNGGLLTSLGGFLGRNPGSDGIANVTSGGKWTNTGTLTIGNQGQGSLTINGGSVTSDAVIMGSDPATPDIQNSLIVSGTNGSLNTTSFVTTQNLSNIAVSLGGKLTAITTTLSASPGSNTVVLVNDTSGLNLGTLIIGDQGFARINLLGLQTKLTATDVILGNQDGSEGALETALFANTVNFASTVVGNRGDGTILATDKNTLNLGDTLVAVAANATGIITFEAGGTLTTASLKVGERGTGKVTLKNKANFSTGDVTIADMPHSTGAVTVDTGTKWLSFGNLVVGHQGDASLSITAGATAAVAHASIGDDPAGTGMISLAGNGSKLTVTSSLVVGIAGAAPKSDILDIGSGTSVVSPFTTLNPGGLIRGKGKLVGKLHNAGGVVAPGNSPGTLEIDDDFEQTSGVLEIQAAGLLPGDFDHLTITGAANIHGGTILFSFLDGYAPRTGDAFSFLEANGVAAIDFSSTTLSFEGVAPGFQFTVEPDAFSGYQFRALSDSVAIPEPSAMLSFACMALCTLRRRRKS